MWLITKYGAFSVVQANTPNLVQVRGRRMKDMRMLADILEAMTGEAPEIHETLLRDYLYRIYLDRDTWVELAGVLADDINYHNFKDAASKGADIEWKKALIDIWSRLWDLQDRTSDQVMDFRRMQ